MHKSEQSRSILQVGGAEVKLNARHMLKKSKALPCQKDMLKKSIAFSCQKES